MSAPDGRPNAPQGGQPDPEASSDGDGSWTEDPITADPDEDRSVDAVIERTSPAATGDEGV